MTRSAQASVDGDPRSPIDLATAALLAACVVATAAFLLSEIYSLDIWWQVAIGRDILASGELPRLDRYTVAGLGRPYHDSHWLFQVAAASAHRLLGWPGVQVLVFGIWGLALAFCYRSARRWAAVAPSALCVFVAAMASIERFLPRPEIVTFLGIAVFYFLLQEGRYRGWRAGLVLGVVQCLWTNSHGLFVIGPFMVLCYGLDALVRRRRGELIALSKVLAVVLVATLANPYFLGAWSYAALLATEAGPEAAHVFQALGELSPTFGAPFRSSPAFWFFAALLAASAVAAVATTARRGPWARLLIVGALAVAALAGRRNVVLFCLAAAPFLAESLAAWVPRSWRPPRRAVLAGAAAIAIWAAYPLSGAFWVRMGIPARTGWGVTPSFFPHDLPALLDRVGFEGPVLNSNTLGGFFLFHGYPARLPLTDGRWEIYDPDELQWILEVTRHPTAWRRAAERYGARGLLLAHSSPEAAALLPAVSSDPSWRLVYLDLAASFWLPAPAAAGSGLEGVNLADPPAPRRLDDGMILDGFLAAAGGAEGRLRNLRRTLELGGREDLLLETIGGLQLELGRFTQAEQTFGRLLLHSPDDPEVLNELAFLSYRRGDLARAVGLMRRVVRLAPDNAELRENLARVESALAQAGGTVTRGDS